MPKAPVTILHGPLPEWMQVWQKTKSHSRDLELIEILAKTGSPRRSEVAAAFAKQTKVQTASGGIARLFNRCARMELIELVKAKSETIGSSTHHLVRLTVQGRDACRLLLNIEPAESQLTELLKRHKNPEHTLLNLEAADLLRSAGYTVDLFPARITLPDN